MASTPVPETLRLHAYTSPQVQRAARCSSSTIHRLIIRNRLAPDVTASKVGGTYVLSTTLSLRELSERVRQLSPRVGYHFTKGKGKPAATATNTTDLDAVIALAKLPAEKRHLLTALSALPVDTLRVLVDLASGE